jgi:plastin-1
MMHFHSLSSVRGAARVAREEDLVRWATDTVRRAGGTQTIESFRDASLRTGLFVADLLAALEPPLVNRALLTPGTTGTPVMRVVPRGHSI